MGSNLPLCHKMVLFNLRETNFLPYRCDVLQLKVRFGTLYLDHSVVNIGILFHLLRLSTKNMNIKCSRYLSRVMTNFTKKYYPKQTLLDMLLDQGKKGYIRSLMGDIFKVQEHLCLRIILDINWKESSASQRHSF